MVFVGRVTQRAGDVKRETVERQESYPWRKQRPLDLLPDVTSALQILLPSDTEKTEVMQKKLKYSTSTSQPRA